MISLDDPRRWSFRFLTQRIETPFHSRKVDRPLRLAFQKAADRLVQDDPILLDDVQIGQMEGSGRLKREG